MTIRLARKVRERANKFSHQINGSTLTNVQTNTVVARRTFRANTLHTGDVLRISGIGSWGVAGTETFRMRILFGGTVVFDTEAFDPALTLGGWKLDALLAVEVGGASSTLTCCGLLLAINTNGDLQEADCRGDRASVTGAPSTLVDQDLVIDISQTGVATSFQRDAFIVEHIKAVESTPVAAS